MAKRTSTLRSPEGTWWGPLGRDERIWVTAATVWALILFITMMFVWPAFGQQQTPDESYRVEPERFHELTQDFIDEHQTGTVEGLPVVTPPPGGDVYMEASRFQFQPVVRLQQGETYRFLISSYDVQHGFSLQPGNINLQVLPGYVQVAHLTPQETGEYAIVCNEYCGLGHHEMNGRIIVVDK